MNNSLLTPLSPALKGDLGRKPHLRYRLIRGKFEEIVQARDVQKLSNRQAALAVGLRGSKEFEEAYELLKKHGEAIVMRNDWTGVEMVLYARFPHYLRDPQFHQLLDLFKDPRPRQTAAPVLPVPVAPPASSPAPTPEPVAPSAVTPVPQAQPDEARPPVVRRYGKPTERDPAIMAKERAAQSQQ